MQFLSKKIIFCCCIGLSINLLLAEQVEANFFDRKQDNARRFCLENNSVLIQNKEENKNDLIEDLTIIERARLRAMQKNFKQSMLNLEEEYARKESVYKALLRSSNPKTNEVEKLCLELEELEKEIILKNTTFSAEIVRKFK